VVAAVDASARIMIPPRASVTTISKRDSPAWCAQDSDGVFIDGARESAGGLAGGTLKAQGRIIDKRWLKPCNGATGSACKAQEGSDSDSRHTDGSQQLNERKSIFHLLFLAKHCGAAAQRNYHLTHPLP
jgi:hypothetical protein